MDGDKRTFEGKTINLQPKEEKPGPVQEVPAQAEEHKVKESISELRQIQRKKIKACNVFTNFSNSEAVVEIKHLEAMIRELDLNLSP